MQFQAILKMLWSELRDAVVSSPKGVKVPKSLFQRWKLDGHSIAQDVPYIGAESHLLGDPKCPKMLSAKVSQSIRPYLVELLLLLRRNNNGVWHSTVAAAMEQCAFSSVTFHR